MPKARSMTKKIVLAPDKFKGSLSAGEAVEAMKRGVLEAVNDACCVECPMADGGEGTVDVFLARGAKRKSARVRGPRGAMVDAGWALDGHTAIVEMAAASGLGLLEKSQQDPTRTDSFGTGQLLEAAMDAGASHVIIGIGGSATNDAGTGMLRALGVRYFDGQKREICASILDFEQLASIDIERLNARIASTKIEVAMDVDNPLCGPEGASYVFGAQKGATPDQIAALDRVLQHVADVSEKTLGRDYRNEPGAGAAGGLGFALMAFLGASLHPGVELIARECGLDGALSGAALCMTGEGKIDMQTLHGKTVAGVTALAIAKNVPVIAFGGRVEEDAAKHLRDRGVEVISIAPAGVGSEESMRCAKTFLQAAACAAAARR